MKAFFCLVATSFMLAGCIAPAEMRVDAGEFDRKNTWQRNTVERISAGNLKPLKDGMTGEQGLSREVVVLAANVKMLAVIEVTAKGNGKLHMGNLDLRVFDAHHDGIHYENGLLTIDFSDINEDGRREL